MNAQALSTRLSYSGPNAPVATKRMEQELVSQIVIGHLSEWMPEVMEDPEACYFSGGHSKLEEMQGSTRPIPFRPRTKRQVYKARIKSTGEVVAIKALPGLTAFGGLCHFTWRTWQLQSGYGLV